MSISRKRTGRTVIGKIVGPHGIKGVLKVHPLTDHPERFFGMTELCAEHPLRGLVSLQVIDIRINESSGDLLFAVENIDDRNTAELYRGCVISVPDDERFELDDDEYWIDSLIGLKVVDDDSGEELGVLKDVLQTGANDVYFVETAERAQKAIPATAEVVKSVDIDGGVMRIKVIDGLWD